MIFYGFDELIKLRQIIANGFPNHFAIHFVVAMGKAVTHGIHHLPRNMCMCVCKCRVNTLNVVGGFANHFDVAYDRVLNEFAGEKTNHVDISCMTLNALN
jgi:hypothetical protein